MAGAASAAAAEAAVACARGHYHAEKQLHDSGHKLKILSETLAVAKDQMDQGKLEWVSKK